MRLKPPTSPAPQRSPAAPASAYGHTKAADEWAVRALCTDSWVVRTAWLYGARGLNFMATMQRLAAERDELIVVDCQRDQPSSTLDLAGLLVRMVAADATAGIYHGTATGETTWHGLAQAVYEEEGLAPAQGRPTTSAAYVRPALRPAYSVLSRHPARCRRRLATGQQHYAWGSLRARVVQSERRGRRR